MAALVGGLYGGTGIQPAQAPTLVPVPTALPQTLVSPIDYLNALELRQPAVAGSILDVQVYLRAELEAAYPALEGTLLFMPYKADGTQHHSAHEFAEQVVEQYHRSKIGQQMDAREDLDLAHIDNTIRHQAHAIYSHEVDAQKWDGSHGYHQEARIIIPVDRDEHVFNFGIIALEDDCSSCKQVKPEPAAQCLSTHPDKAFIERSRRINIAFHELGHHISHFSKAAGHAYVTEEERHTEETRAELFGSFMEVRLFGPSHALQLKVISDRNAESMNTYKYFNPRTFNAGYVWLHTAGVGSVQQLAMPELFNRASSIAQANAMTLTEIEQFNTHKAHVDKGYDKPAQRVSAYRHALVSGIKPSSITVNGITLPYPEIAYQYDLAKLRNAAVGGNQYHNQLVQTNPLRTPALAGNQFEEVDITKPKQVDAINNFNAALYGAEACIIKPPQVALN